MLWQGRYANKRGGVCLLLQPCNETNAKSYDALRSRIAAAQRQHSSATQSLLAALKDKIQRPKTKGRQNKDSHG